MTTKVDALECSFCGKREAEVTIVIPGPGVNICDECAESCEEIAGLAKARRLLGCEGSVFSARSVEAVQRTRSRTLAAAALLGGHAVLAGAFAAHGLRDHLDESFLAAFEVGVRYQMYHALALAAVAVAPAMPWDGRWTRWACRAWVCGVAIFSGSLYLLALTGARWWGAITPIGGVALVLGWAFLLIAALSNRRKLK
jgi:uncharacterized membrane protein YgdD (TMEM256/DUF423 family)